MTVSDSEGEHIVLGFECVTAFVETTLDPDTVITTFTSNNRFYTIINLIIDLLVLINDATHDTENRISAEMLRFNQSFAELVLLDRFFTVLATTHLS